MKLKFGFEFGLEESGMAVMVVERGWRI